MKQNLEREYKTLLTQVEYSHLLETHFRHPHDIIHQTNVYYDTADFQLKKQHCMMRIRHTSGQQEFTLKVPNAVHENMEYSFKESSLSLDDPRIIQTLSQCHLTAPLIQVATSKTTRKTIVDSLGEWCLDFTQFDNSQDFELEYEILDLSANSYSIFHDFLLSNQIVYKPALPKFLRALESQV